METLKRYYNLTKPGIIYGNALNTTAGFLFASFGHVHMPLLIITLYGSSLVIAAGCVFNNILDRDIDARMVRTKKRALVTKKISIPSALIFGAILATAGFIFLSFTNWLTVLIGLFGLFAYVVLYGIAKRKTVYGTLVGSISGAVPMLAGYTAVNGRLDTAGWLLAVILACWQMPHFYAIAIYRLKEYKSAGLPVLSVKQGVRATKRQIMFYSILFLLACWSLWVLNEAGPVYLVIVTILGLRWLYSAWQGFSAKDDNLWARTFFGFSLLVVIGLDAALALAFLFS